MTHDEEVRILLIGIHQLKLELELMAMNDANAKGLFEMHVRLHNLNNILTDILWKHYGLRDSDAKSRHEYNEQITKIEEEL